MTFEELVAARGPSLRAALIAAYGLEIGLDAASEALAWGWEHRDRLAGMVNPAGYLYRVGQTAARRLRRDGPPTLPVPADGELPEVEPRLVGALAELSEQQRVVVVLVHAFGWRISEAADLLDISHATARTHLQRAMSRLRSELEVPDGR